MLEDKYGLKEEMLMELFLSKNMIDYSKPEWDEMQEKVIVTTVTEFY